MSAATAPTPISASQPVAVAPRRYAPDALLYAIMLFTWVSVWRIQDLFPPLGKIQFPILIELTTLLLFFSDGTPSRRVFWIRSPLLAIILALFGIMIFGLPLSLYPGKGLTFILRDFLPNVVLMLILATSVRERSDLDWFALLHLIGGAMYAVYIRLYFPVYGGRLAGLIFYDANDFALIIVCTIPFAVYFLRPGVAPWKRFGALASIPLFITMLIRSGSRGGFLGFIAVMLYILFRYRAIPSRVRIGAVVGGVFLLLIAGSTSYWQMMGTLLHPKSDYNWAGNNDTGRMEVWKRGIGYMVTHPIFGVGVRAFAQAEGKLSAVAQERAERGRGIKWSVAHNSYVEIGAECGVFALALFLLMLMLMLRTLDRVRAGPPGSSVTLEDEAYAQMLIASLIGYMVAGFFLSAEYFAYLYVLLGLTVGQYAVLRRRARYGVPAVATPHSEVTQIHPRRRRAASTWWVPAGQ